MEIKSPRQRPSVDREADPDHLGQRVPPFRFPVGTAPPAHCGPSHLQVGARALAVSLSEFHTFLSKYPPPASERMQCGSHSLAASLLYL